MVSSGISGDVIGHVLCGYLLWHEVIASNWVTGRVMEQLRHHGGRSILRQVITNTPMQSHTEVTKAGLWVVDDICSCVPPL